MRNQVVRTGFKRTDKLKTLKHQEKIVVVRVYLEDKILEFPWKQEGF